MPLWNVRVNPMTSLSPLSNLTNYLTRPTLSIACAPKRCCLTIGSCFFSVVPLEDIPLDPKQSPIALQIHDYIFTNLASVVSIVCAPKISRLAIRKCFFCMVPLEDIPLHHKQSPIALQIRDYIFTNLASVSHCFYTPR